MRNDKYNYDNSDKSLANGISAFVSSFLFFGGSYLIYYFKLKENTMSKADSIFLWIIAIIIFLSGVSLFLWSWIVIVQNIVKIIKGETRSKSEFTGVSTHPVAGLITFFLCLMFSSISLFFEYPRYKADPSNKEGLIAASIFAVLTLVYSVFVLFANLFKRK